MYLPRIYLALADTSQEMGSSAMSEMIRWAYQPLHHALAGALIADRIFAHEIFVASSPKEQPLRSDNSRAVTGRGLRGVFEEDTGQPYWKNLLWEPYREAHRGSRGEHCETRRCSGVGQWLFGI